MPFHAVMILSSRCGRGRFARASKSFFRESASDFAIAASGFFNAFAASATDIRTMSVFCPLNSPCGSLGALPASSTP